MPSVPRVQLQDSVQLSVEQEPPEHRGPEQFFVPEAVRSHVLEYAHPPQAVQVALPHDWPSVVRLHVQVSLLADVPEQEPPAQVGVVQLLLPAPDSEQAFAKAQPPHEPQLFAPHTVPSGSVVGAGHAAAWPSHRATWQPPPADWHTVPAAFRASAGQAKLVPSHVSTTSQGPAAGRQSTPAALGTEPWQP